MAVDIDISWFGPRLEVRIQNQDAFLRRVADRMAAAVKARTAAGVDFEGAMLHRSKDAGSKWNPAGRPMSRTGQLVNSIGVRAVGPDWYRVVALGERAEFSTRTKELRRKSAVPKIVRFQEVTRFTAKGKAVTAYRFKTSERKRLGTIARILELPEKGSALRPAGKPPRPPMAILKTTDAELRAAVEAELPNLDVSFRQVGETSGT